MRIAVVLVRPQGPINLGQIARLCANLNADLRLVAPQCDISSVEARMFAHHAQPLLASAAHFATLSEAVADCHTVVGTSARARRGAHVVLGPESIHGWLNEHDAAQVALVFGNEQDGLSQDEIDVCDVIIKLATPGSYPSYNLSQAVAIVLYFTTLAIPQIPPLAENVSRQATAGQRARLYDLWLQVLNLSGYFRRTEVHRFAPKLHTMISRLRLSQYDLNLLMGMLTHCRFSIPPHSFAQPSPKRTEN